MDETIKGIIGLLLIAGCFALIFVGPIFTIWAVNTLFGTEISYTFKNWVAVVWLCLLVRGVNITLARNS